MAADNTDLVQTEGGAMQAFSFGDPEPLLDRTAILGMMMCWQNGKWYEPPVSLAGLARSFHMSPHHSSAITLKRNLLARSFEASRWLTRADFARFAKDYLALGNGFLERTDNLAGRPLALKPSLAVYTRVGIEAGQYFFVPTWRDIHEFRPGSVFHLFEPDLEQEIYGVPDWMAALQSGLLNEAATLFRRRYYLNGSHAGFILYLSEPTMNNEDAEAIRTALKEAKGLGNFKNLFLHAPDGKKDGVQLIPISEVAAKDEFLNIKKATQNDILAAHRVPPQLIGVVPENNAGFGNVIDAWQVFFELEIEPLQMRILELNDWLGVEAVRFRPFVPPAKRP